jgi:hypothetical protein
VTVAVQSKVDMVQDHKATAVGGSTPTRGTDVTLRPRPSVFVEALRRTDHPFKTCYQMQKDSLFQNKTL